MWEQAHDLNRDARHINAFASRIFCESSMRPGSLSVLPTAEPFETTGEDFPVKDLPVAKEGVDIMPEPVD